MIGRDIKEVLGRDITEVLGRDITPLHCSVGEHCSLSQNLGLTVVLRDEIGSSITRVTGCSLLSTHCKTGTKLASEQPLTPGPLSAHMWPNCPNTLLARMAREDNGRIVLSFYFSIYIS